MNTPCLRLLPGVLLFAALAPGAQPAQDAPPQGPRGPATHVLLAPLETDRLIAAVRATDNERIAATMAADSARLSVIFADELRYGHSSGRVDTKASLLTSLTTRTSVYESYDYKERTFLAVAPGLVLMTGRVLILARNGAQKTALDLNFLAVWREENGRWRFLAWQSCRNPPPAAPGQ